jgi:hypothetical protein
MRKFPHPAVFDALSADQRVLIEQRTHCDIDTVKKGYQRCVQEHPLTKEKVLQFVFHPAGYDGDYRKEWNINKTAEGFLIYDEEGQISEVTDPPTMRLLEAVLDMPAKPFVLQPTATMNWDEIVTAKQLEEKFGITPSTLKSWEKRGLPSAGLPPLQTDLVYLNNTNQRTCRLGDVKPFIDRLTRKQRSTSKIRKRS